MVWVEGYKREIKSSPWGAVQNSEHLGSGIYSVSTSSHGGIFVPPELNRQIPAYLRNADGFYEEDSDWAIPALAFPQVEWFAKNQDGAKNTLKKWRPNEYEKFFGVKLNEGESPVRDKELFNERNKGNYVVSAAWGSWHKQVPKGMVGALARRKEPYDEAYFLVPEKEYDARHKTRTGIFVVDLTRHQKIGKIE